MVESELRGLLFRDSLWLLKTDISAATSSSTLPSRACVTKTTPFCILYHRFSPSFLVPSLNSTSYTQNQDTSTGSGRFLSKVSIRLRRSSMCQLCNGASWMQVGILPMYQNP
jgi:hypothetical protein